MAINKPAMKPAKDRGETVSLMEPLLIGDGSRHRAALTDLALELAQKSAGSGALSPKACCPHSPISRAR